MNHQLDVALAEIGKTEQYRAAVNQIMIEFHLCNEEILRLKQLIELDRTGLAGSLVECRKVVDGYSWLANGAWGSYELERQTEATLRREISSAFDEILRIVEDGLVRSSQRVTDAFKRPLQGKLSFPEEDNEKAAGVATQSSVSPP